MNAPPGRRSGPSCETRAAANVEVHTTDTTTVTPTGSGVRVIPVSLVEARTPTGETRRRIYLSDAHADEKATEWRRRGWSITTHRKALHLPAVAS